MLLFVNHGGLLRGNVSDTKYRRSPLPQGGLEIPMTLSLYQGKATAEEYKSPKSFINEYYCEPEDIPSSSANKGDSDNDNDEEVVDLIMLDKSI